VSAKGGGNASGATNMGAGGSASSTRARRAGSKRASGGGGAGGAPSCPTGDPARMPSTSTSSSPRSDHAMERCSGLTSSPCAADASSSASSRRSALALSDVRAWLRARLNSSCDGAGSRDAIPCLVTGLDALEPGLDVVTTSLGVAARDCAKPVPGLGGNVDDPGLEVLGDCGAGFAGDCGADFAGDVAASAVVVAAFGAVRGGVGGSSALTTGKGGLPALVLSASCAGVADSAESRSRLARLCPVGGLAPAALASAAAPAATTPACPASPVAFSSVAEMWYGKLGGGGMWLCSSRMRLRFLFFFAAWFSTSDFAVSWSKTAASPVLSLHSRYVLTATCESFAETRR